jgi:hypothetical protein
MAAKLISLSVLTQVSVQLVLAACGIRGGAKIGKDITRREEKNTKVALVPLNSLVAAVAQLPQ